MKKRFLGSRLSSAAVQLQPQQPLHVDIASQDFARSSYTAAAKPSVESDSNGTGTYSSTTTFNAQTSQMPNAEKKYNIYLSTTRSGRLELDLSKDVSAVSRINNTVQSQAIKDCFCLGKFNPQRPQPILVKFITIAISHNTYVHLCSMG